ncbi:MAG TPA: tetrahydrofolate dehydrogenase/cyclohydrolase catalytic domain-containing protein [Bacillota bacterium]|nr:tetrahydrofolate dehydrogenase/cyclohydrolase catalytic domain-containing protein [Bacillota bacterium]
MIHALESAAIVHTMTADLRSRTHALAREFVVPHLVIVEGVDAMRVLDTGSASEVNTYVHRKIEAATGVGIVATHVPVPTSELLDRIEWFNDDPDVTGMILEIPIPGLEGEEADAVAMAMNANKAVDNQGAEQVWGMGATPEATIRLLDTNPDRDFSGKGQTVMVVGSEGHVGAQVVEEYSHRAVKDLICIDQGKGDLAKGAAAADIIIAATGVRGIITADMIHNGQAIVSVGANDVHPDARKLTDLDFWLTPKVGGVGPSTTMHLFGRVVMLAEGGEPMHPFRPALTSAER